MGAGRLRRQRRHHRRTLAAPQRRSRDRRVASSRRQGGGHVPRAVAGAVGARGRADRAHRPGRGRGRRGDADRLQAGQGPRHPRGRVRARARAALRAGADPRGERLSRHARRDLLRGLAAAGRGRDRRDPAGAHAGAPRGAARQRGEAGAAAASRRQPQVSALLAGRDLPTRRAEPPANRRRCAGAPADAWARRRVAAVRPHRRHAHRASGRRAAHRDPRRRAPHRPVRRHVAGGAVRQRADHHAGASRAVRPRRHDVLLVGRRLVLRDRAGHGPQERRAPTPTVRDGGGWGTLRRAGAPVRRGQGA